MMEMIVKKRRIREKMMEAVVDKRRKKKTMEAVVEKSRRGSVSPSPFLFKRFAILSLTCPT